MKKDRNSFFESSNYNMSAMGNPYGMTPPMQGMNAASNNFYASQNMPSQMPQMIQPTVDNNLNELESRIAKLERSINRLDARLSKLEGSTFYPNESDNNMYMV